MNLRRKIACAISNVVAVSRCFCAPRQGLRILMYHAIGSPALGDSLGLFSLHPDLFEEHMDHLANHYSGHVVGLDPNLSIGPGTNMAITFDDGYQDNLDIAAPILVSRNLPFTVFVTAEFVRNARAGFLSIAGLRELAALPGVRIGAHGATHIALSGCDDRLLHEELVSSRRYLEDAIGAGVLTMAYPYGAANRRVRDAVEKAGYRIAACSYADINDKNRDQLLLGRTEILAGDTLKIFNQKLRGDWDWYRWRGKDPASL